MDLTEAIVALTKAVEENTATLRKQIVLDHIPPSAPAFVEKAAAMEAEIAAPAALTYEANVRPLALRLSAEKGRDALVALLAKFGVKKGQDLVPDQFPAFIDAANAALGE